MELTATNSLCKYKYMHLAGRGKRGKAKAGQEIGTIGDTGTASKGVHLHFVCLRRYNSGDKFLPFDPIDLLHSLGYLTVKERNAKKK